MGGFPNPPVKYSGHIDHNGRNAMDGKESEQKQRVVVKQLVCVSRDRLVFEATDGEYYEMLKEGRTDIEMFVLLWGPNWREDCLKR